MPINFSDLQNHYPSCLELRPECRRDREFWLTVNFGLQELPHRFSIGNNIYRVNLGLQGGTMHVVVSGQGFIPSNKRNFEGRFDLIWSSHDNPGYCGIKVEGHETDINWNIRNAVSKSQFMRGTITNKGNTLQKLGTIMGSNTFTVETRFITLDLADIYVSVIEAFDANGNSVTLPIGKRKLDIEQIIKKYLMDNFSPFSLSSVTGAYTP